jgi:hypothetical protein
MNCTALQGAGELRYHYGEEMRNYQYFIYKIESRPDALGEYVGPFPTEEARDAEAIRLRSIHPGRGRTECIYRANVDDQLAEALHSPTIVAA